MTQDTTQDISQMAAIVKILFCTTFIFVGLILYQISPVISKFKHLHLNQKLPNSLKPPWVLRLSLSWDLDSGCIWAILQLTFKKAGKRMGKIGSRDIFHFANKKGKVVVWELGVKYHLWGYMKDRIQHSKTKVIPTRKNRNTVIILD